jgi:hypothetical protein
MMAEIKTLRDGGIKKVSFRTYAQAAICMVARE